MSKRFTAEELAKLREIAEAATPGSRTATHSDGDYFKLVGADDVSIIDGCGCCGSPWLDGIDPDADARFFAEFHREQVLALLDEIERLRRERAQAEFLIRSAIGWIYDEETGERAWDDSDYRHALEELRQAIDLLCPEKGGDRR